MPKYILHYFVSRGLGEAIRYMFHYANVSFEDIRIAHKDFQEIREKFPFSQVPVLEIDGVFIAQSQAIQRYLAHQFDLLPDDPLEAAQCDMLAAATKDIIPAFYNVITPILRKQQNAEPIIQKQWEIYRENCVVPQMRRFTKLFEENLNKSGWFVGNKLTWVDFVIAEELNRFHDLFDRTIFDDFPMLEEHNKRVHDLPGVKEYVAIRPVTPL